MSKQKNKMSKQKQLNLFAYFVILCLMKEVKMMLSEELIELANQTMHLKAETQTLEVKAAHGGCPKKLYDTLSSFSNQDGGGVILFGLDESKNFACVGVYDLQDLQKKVTEQCNQMIPPVRAVFTVAELDGEFICSAEIPSADLMERPCYYSGAGRIKGSYVRVGDADLPMTDYEIYTYEAFRKHLHDDERVIERAKMSLLDQDKVQGYLLRMREERPGFSKLSMEQAYEMLAITRDGIPTLAAVLNALIHRDYSHFTEGTPIQINFFTDRMEIHSPGGLYGRMTVEDLGKSRPDLRNPALATMSEFLLKTENRYSGIPTIRREMAAAGLPAPVFINRRNEFIVIFYNKQQTEENDAEKEQNSGTDTLLEFCRIPRTRREIADYLGINTVFYVMQHYVQPLLASGKLVMTIPEKPKSRNQKFVTKEEREMF